MKKITLAVLSSAMFFGSSVYAQDRTLGQIYTECGLGGIIGSAFDNQETRHLVAISTNVTWDWGTTAISSNVSSPASCAGGEVKTAALIIQTYPQLENDIAMGEGVHLTSLLNAAGCATESHAAITNNLRADFASSVSADDYTSQTRFEQAEALHQQFIKHAAASCNI
jgi:hypothetical protein